MAGQGYYTQYDEEDFDEILCYLLDLNPQTMTSPFPWLKPWWGDLLSAAIMVERPLESCQRNNERNLPALSWSREVVCVEHRKGGVFLYSVFRCHCSASMGENNLFNLKISKDIELPLAQFAFSRYGAYLRLCHPQMFRTWLDYFFGMEIHGRLFLVMIIPP